jgi:two-component system, OmpR family, sensor histidine kinase VicK
MSWALQNQTQHNAAALVAAASGASVAAIGGLVVAGWLTVAVALIQVLPGLPPMQYNTALGFMICGAAMLAAALELRRPTALLGALASVIGLTTLSQFVFGADLGIDDLLVETYVLTGVSNPGRMPPNSALGLTLIGAALLGLSWPTISQSRHLYPALLGSIVIALGTAALVGYAAGMPGAYGWSHYNRMSVHTALGFILLGGGVVGLAWNAAQRQTSETPSWLPTLAGVAVATVTLCLWYALISPSHPHIERAAAPEPIANGALPNITLAAGLLSAILLGWSLKVEQTSRQRARSLAASNLALDQQSQAREKAEETLHQLAAIVQNSNDAIIATSLDGIILTWNAGAQRLYGYTEDEVRGRHISLLHSRKEQGHDLFKRVGWGENIEQLETVNLTKDGRKIDVSLTLSPMLDRTGRVIGASSIARDITERKQVDQMKDEFVGTVSHELRTPLTAIKGFIELVADGDAGPVTEAQREFLEIASRNTDRLGSLINDLLDINRIEAQRFEIRLAPADLSAVLKDVAATFGPMAQAKGLTFHCRIDPLPGIMGDSARLVQVFSNLVSNAIKYTLEGEVGIRARRADAGVEVVVYDSGIGLTREERSQLFTKFFRGRNPVVAESGGTGLGLVIAKAIIEKHRGIIEVASVPGEGTHFRVVLPLQAAG